MLRFPVLIIFKTPRNCEHYYILFDVYTVQKYQNLKKKLLKMTYECEEV